MRHPRGRPGIGVDAHGNQVVDPTQNVKDLTEASIKRIDDMNELRALLADEQIKRMEREWIHLDRMASLREQHAREARESEAKRLDAIRATDVAAVSTTAAQSLAAIQALASTATATAETLRNQVATTATTIANQTDRIVSPIMERLAALEKIVNIGQGRSTVADPQMTDLMNEMRSLARGRATDSGKSEGMSDSGKLLMLLLAVVTALMGIYTFTQRGTTTAAPASQIIVVPAGAPIPSAVQSG